MSAFGNRFNPNCPLITTPSDNEIYSKIQQEITRLEVIGETIPQVDRVYSPIGPVRNLLLLWLKIKYGNLLLSPSIEYEYNGFRYTIDDNDTVTESESDKTNNQKVYEQINIYFQDPEKYQVGISITYVHPTNPVNNHNSVVIIRKNGSSYEAFHYETYGSMAQALLPNLTTTSRIEIDRSLKRMFSNNITVYSTRSPVLNQALIGQIQNSQEGGMCIAISLFVIYLSFFVFKTHYPFTPQGTHINRDNITCFNIEESKQLNCIRGFMKEASDGIIQRLYPLGNLASAFSITELSKYHRMQDQRIIIYLDKVLKYIIDGYNNWKIDLGLSGPVTHTINPDDLKQNSLKKFTDEEIKILGLFVAAKNAAKKAEEEKNKLFKRVFTKPSSGLSGKKTEVVKEKVKQLPKKKGGSTKKKQKKRKSKRRKTRKPRKY
jgi:hypothetical protein